MNTNTPLRAAPAASAETAEARWRYERMRPVDLAEAIHRRPIAWLVVSPLEWHGEAIAFSADPLVGQAIIERAWQTIGGVLLPTLHLGVETEYKVWEKDGLATYRGMEVITRQHNPGSLYLQPLTLELVMRDMLASLARQGFRICVVMTGHLARDHVRVLEEVSRRDHGDMRVLLAKTLGDEELPAELRFAHGQNAPHADVDEASLVGAIDPSLVDRASFGVIERDQKAGLLKENAGAIDFDKGRAIIDHNVRELERRVKELLERKPE